MTPRHLALAVIAVVVVGMGVYLFVEVHSSPAEAQVAEVPPAPAPQTPAQEARHAEPPRVAAMRGGPGRPEAPAPAPTPTPAPTMPSDDSNEASVDDMMKANPKLDAIMDRANKAYDHQDFDEAKAIAGKVLTKQPGNVRMLRIMVSSSCIDGDVVVAQKYFPQLPKFDREQMKQRCDRYGVTLTDP